MKDFQLLPEERRVVVSAGEAMERLKDLKNCEAHMTHIPTPGDVAGLRRLGINLTTDPYFATNDLFVP